MLSALSLGVTELGGRFAPPGCLVTPGRGAPHDSLPAYSARELCSRVPAAHHLTAPVKLPLVGSEVGASAVADDFYVYLLVDVDPTGVEPEQIFYVGKGHDSRALHHVLEYVEAVRRAELAIAADVLAKASGQQVADNQAPAEEHAKVKRIREIVEAGREVRVDLLRDALSSPMAYAIESAAIDVLDPAKLTNLVAGHEHFRAPASAVVRMLTAKDVEIQVPALQVTVVGLWGGRSIAGLADATDQAVIWENARQSWSIGLDRRQKIDAAAASSEPIVLVAVSKGPQALWGGIILGAWEITTTSPGQVRIYRSKNGQERATPGWEFVRLEQQSPRLAALRESWLSEPRRSTTKRQVGPMAINF